MRRAIATPLLGWILLGCSAPYESAPPYEPPSLAGAGAPGRRSEVERAGEGPESRDAGRAGTGREPLNLRDCIQLARLNNLNLRIADRRVLIAEDKFREAWSNLIPKVTASGRIESRSNERAGRLGDQTFVMGDRTVGSAGVSTLVPIYLFGRVANQGEAEKIRVDVAELEAERRREDLDLLVSLAYFRILEAEKIRSVVVESIQVVERQLEISRDFYRQGLVAKNDVLAAEVQLAERQDERIRSENNIQLATATLNRLMGIDVNLPTRVADVLEVAPWRGTFQEILRAAIERRPDLESLRKEIRIAQAEYRATRSNLLPYIYGFGGYSYTSDSFLLNEDWFSGGFAIEFPLFDAPTFLMLKRKTKEIAEAVDLRDERTEDVVLEVKRAYLNVREAAERIPVTRKSIEQADENLRMIRDQYAQGLVTSADVLTEEDRLSRARSSYYRSLYDYHSSYARMKNVISGDPSESSGPMK